MSDSDIESGARGLSEIAKALSSINYGLICLTEENVSAPWINFEAGALSKSVDDGRIVPLLLGFDPKRLPAPLGQFQARKIEKSGINRLILDINNASSKKIDASRLSMLFEKLWPSLETSINKILEAESVEAPSPISDKLVARTVQISELALDMLTNAATDDHGVISVGKYIGGTSFSAGRKDYALLKGQRDIARHQAAVEELERIGLIRDVGSEGEVFQVTNEGYKRADSLDRDVGK